MLLFSIILQFTAKATYVLEFNNVDRHFVCVVASQSRRPDAEYI